MTSVRALRLAIRLSRSPSGRLRLGLIVAGSALATVALLSMAAVPGVAARQRGRLAEQTLQRPEQGNDAAFWADQQDELWRGRFLTRILIADGGGDGSPPWWLADFPEPGEVAISPALARAMEDDPDLLRRFPQQVTGPIDADVLVSPDQMLAVVGATREQLDVDGAQLLPELGYYRDLGASGFGSTGVESIPDPRAIRLMALGLTIFVVIPASMLVASSARLSWRTLERRLSALRLVGLTAGQVRLITAVEAAGVAAAGVAAGVAIWLIAVPHSDRLAIGPVHWWSHDVSTSPQIVLTVAAALISLTALTSQIGLRRLGLDPLRVRAEHADLPLSLARLAPLGIGLALLAGAYTRAVETASAGWLAVYGLGDLLCVVGMVLALPFAARLAARLLRLAGGRPVTELAASRIAHETRAVSRVLAALLAITFISGIGFGLAATLQMATESTREHPGDGRVRLLIETAPVQAEQLSSLPGVRSVLPVRPVDLGAGWVISIDATCPAVASLATSIDGSCSSEGLVHPVSSPSASVVAGADHPLTSPVDFSFDWPDGSSGPGPADVVVDASIEATRQPASKWIVEIAPTADLEAVQSELLRRAPGASLANVASTDRGRLITTYNSVLLAGMGIGVALTLLATLSAVADRAAERRRASQQLAAVGLPVSLLRCVETLTLTAPLLVGLGVATAVSAFSVATYMRIDAELPAFPVRVLVWLLIVVAGVITSIAVTTFVVARPDTDRLTPRQE